MEAKKVDAKEVEVHRAAVKARAQAKPKGRKKAMPYPVQQVLKGKKDIDMAVAEQMKPPHTLLYDVALKNSHSLMYSSAREESILSHSACCRCVCRIQTRV